jgi:hypothetical protein
MDLLPDRPSRLLNAVRSGLVFNALVIMLMASVTTAVLYATVPEWFKLTFAGAFAVGLVWMAVWVNIAIRRHPREMSYGPQEYLEERRLEHERRMKNTEGS